MRQGELMRMRWRDLDFARRVVIIEHTKTERPRTVALTDKVIAELRAHPRTLRDEKVFASTVNSLYKRFRKAVKAAGIRQCRWHDQEHSALHLLAASSNLAPQPD